MYGTRRGLPGGGDKRELKTVTRTTTRTAAGLPEKRQEAQTWKKKQERRATLTSGN